MAAAARRSPSLLYSRLFRILALADAAEAPRWCGYLRRRDYVRARLGVPWGTWCSWRRIGRLLLASPEALAAFHREELTVSALDLLARYCPVDRVPCVLGLASRLSHRELRDLLQEQLAASPEGPADATEDEPGWETLHLSLPGDMLPYVEESFELARALIGRQVDDHESLEAILAEASEALPDGLPGEPPPQLRGRRRKPRLRLRQLPPLDGTRRDRNTARALDALSMRCLRAQRAFQLEEEDRLLGLLESGAHREAGHTNFDHYCDQVLRLAPSTAWDRIGRARRRRRNDPVAHARAEGRLTAVQFDLLSQLREFGVDASALPDWIALAPQHPVLHLQEMIRWARIQAATRPAEWARDGFAPPNDEQLRTSSRPLEEILADPEPPAVETLDTGARCSLRLRLPSRLAADLRAALHRLQQASADEHGRRLPRWWAFLHLLGLARRAWACNVEDPGARSRMRAVFSRDRYICQAPDCSWRRDLQAHHLRYRSHGGGDELWNLLTLCPFHHLQGEHGGILRVRGKVTDGPGELEWEMGLDEHGRNPLLRVRGNRVIEPQVEGVPVPVPAAAPVAA